MPEAKKRLCIIGAGPSGLALLNAFETARSKGEEIPDIVVFEKQDEPSGLWNYTWRTGVDQYGEQVHSSQYRQLWSNGPKECLELADYSYDEHFGKAVPSYLPRVALRDYILGRVRKNKLLEKFDVRFNYVVRNVEDVKDGGHFKVRYENMNDRIDTTESFDQVIVAIGHFSVPNFPSYPGLNTFPGHVLHSHDFRDSKSYKNQRVVLIGSSYSAEDIALQLHKYGAKDMAISHRNKPMGYKWPSNIKEYPLLKKVEGNTVHFSDNQTYEADAIIFCTGYQYYFPFLPKHLRFDSPNSFYSEGLYKGIIFNDNPSIMFMAMQAQEFSLPMIDIQAFYLRDYVMGKIALPEKSERDADINQWHNRCISGSSVNHFLEFQRDFVVDLLSVSSLYFLSFYFFYVIELF